MKVEHEVFADETNVYGIAAITRPHNENPIGCFAVGCLRECLDLAEELGTENVWLWTTRSDDGNAGLLALTRHLNDRAGIVLAGRNEDQQEEMEDDD